MIQPPPTQLLSIARDERARRKAAVERSGEAQSEQARRDDRIWSNIEQVTGLYARDPVCLANIPNYWSSGEMLAMARSAWATLLKMEQSLDMSLSGNRTRLTNMAALYRWLRPIEWSPSFDQKDFVSALPPPVRKGNWIIAPPGAAA